MPNEPYTTIRKDSFRKMNTLTDEVETWWRIYAISKGGSRFNIEVSDKDLEQAPARLAAQAKRVDSI